MDAPHKKEGGKEDNDRKRTDTQQSMTQRGDDYCCYMEDEGREKNARKRQKRHRQNRPSASRTEGVGGRSWDLMCMALKRHVPDHHSLRQSATTDDPVYDYYAVFARPCVSPGFALAYEILTPYSVRFDRVMIPRIVLAISAVHCHDHCDWTVELRDETNSNTSVPVIPQPPPLIGWVEDSFRRQHPQWIRPGAVLLCQNVPVAVFPSSQTNPSVILEDSSDDELEEDDEDHDDDSGRNLHDVDEDHDDDDENLHDDGDSRQAKQESTRLFPALGRNDEFSPAERYSTHLEKMLLLGEQSVTFVWTPEQDQQQHDDEKDYQMFLHLLQERATAEQRCLGNGPLPTRRRSILASARRKRRRPRKSQGALTGTAITTGPSGPARSPSTGIPINPYKQKNASIATPTTTNVPKAQKPSIEESWEEHLENSRLPPGIQQFKRKVAIANVQGPKPPQSQPEPNQLSVKDKNKTVTATTPPTRRLTNLPSPNTPFATSISKALNSSKQSRVRNSPSPNENDGDGITTNTSQKMQADRFRLVDSPTEPTPSSLLMWTNPILDNYAKKDGAGSNLWAGLNPDEDEDSIDSWLPFSTPRASHQQQPSISDYKSSFSRCEGILTFQALHVSENEESDEE